MRIAVITFEGFNELDSFVASAMLNRVKSLQALIVCPTERVASMNGVVVQSQAPLSFAREADAVIVGSGRGTRDLVRDAGLMGELGLDASRQVIGAQCSGALILAKLGLLADVPACTDSTTKPWVEEAGVAHHVSRAPAAADDHRVGLAGEAQRGLGLDDDPIHRRDPLGGAHDQGPQALDPVEHGRSDERIELVEAFKGEHRDPHTASEV